MKKLNRILWVICFAAGIIGVIGGTYGILITNNITWLIPVISSFFVSIAAGALAIWVQNASGRRNSVVS